MKYYRLCWITGRQCFALACSTDVRPCGSSPAFIFSFLPSFLKPFMINQLKSHPMLDVRKRSRLLTEEGGKACSAGTDQHLAGWGEEFALKKKVGNCDNPYLVPKKEEKSGTATRSLRSPRREVDRTRFELIIKSSFGHDLPFFFDFSISGIKRVKAQWVSPSVQLNLNHCARFVFLSRAIDETFSRFSRGDQSQHATTDTERCTREHRPNNSRDRLFLEESSSEAEHRIEPNT